MKNITRLKLWLAIAAIFALGCATGAFLDSAYRLRAGAARHGARGGKRDPAHAFEKLQRELNLDERQAAEVRRILDQTRDEYRTLRSETRPRFDAIRESSLRRASFMLEPAGILRCRRRPRRGGTGGS